MHVTVELDGDDLVVVKSASGGEAAARLRTEAGRLDQLIHPGVVELLDAGPLPPAGAAASGARDTAGRAPADDEPDDAAGGFQLRLAHAGEPVANWRASVDHVAGVAVATASTLADLHDLGFVHGRLDASHVLVGDDGRTRLCGLGDPGDATPEDDVAAWGRLVADLLARAAHEPRGWRRAVAGRRAGATRRELDRLCHRATDPVASRRPTARAAAEAVVVAVPEARLPAGSPAAARREGDTLDRIWSYAGEPSEAERWAAAFGTTPEAAERRADEPAPPPTLPLALASSPTWDDMLAEDDTPDPEAPRLDDTPDPGRRFDDTPDPGTSRLDDTPHLGGPASRRLTDRSTTGDRGPDERPHRSGRVALAGGAIGLLVAGSALLAARVVRDAGTGPPAAAADDGCPPVAVPAADVDGDGCREALTIEGSTVDAGVARWTLGEPGDVVAVGDWDCDGEATAAVLRPSTGDVFHFPAWAAAGDEVTVAPVDRVEGATSLRRADGSGSCDRLIASGPGGPATDVAVAP